ncbi:hypothetical protein CKO31_18175 [Thiohalocapsa halophila]|uniref:PilZ domain-containing protein n=1 Tax=Thiohalocapsa halophila TaxID=69359 RepID=A0ABS1CLB2_9GAMM|nr:PilZ domain-containing protein [Thiohalocapsa halophila]MBK1632633.1 hypothetical protein [Thiohalocapsa halophila]
MSDFDGAAAEPRIRGERRRFPRAGFDGAVAAEPVPRTISTHAMPLLASDLSEGGLGATAQDFVPSGAKLLVSLEPAAGAEPLRLMGEVVRVAHIAFQDRWSLGIAFDAVSEAERKRLREVVAGRGRG